jgi:uncharacterized small protein (DUF1192 family)
MAENCKVNDCQQRELRAEIERLQDDLAQERRGNFSQQERIAELEVEIERLTALAKEVSGCWSAFEPDLRNAIGHTNYNVVARKIEAALAGKEG